MLYQGHQKIVRPFHMPLFATDRVLLLGLVLGYDSELSPISSAETSVFHLLPSPTLGSKAIQYMRF
jgi:hypothetical protein